MIRSSFGIEERTMKSEGRFPDKLHCESSSPAVDEPGVMADHTVLQGSTDGKPTVSSPFELSMIPVSSLSSIKDGEQDRAAIKGLDVVEVNPLLGNEADKENTLSCAGIVTLFPSLNTTILEISSNLGPDAAVQALTEYSSELASMKFENGRGYKTNHIVEMASVIMKNMHENNSQFGEESMKKGIESITGRLMEQKGEQNNPNFIPLLIGSLALTGVGISLLSKKRE